MIRANSNIAKDRDGGAILVWFALSAVTLIAIGALVIDVGAMWSERRQLTNGADASAMAVAIEAAVNNPGAPIESKLDQLAREYANRNAKDGYSFVEELCGDGPGLTAPATVPGSGCSASAKTSEYDNWVYVKLRTQTTKSSNDDRIKFLLAPLLDAANVGTTLRGAATVAWGVTNGLQVVSMVIGQCVFQDSWVKDGVISFPIPPDDYSVNGRSPVVVMTRDFTLNSSCPDQPGFPYPLGWEYSTNKECKSQVEFVDEEYILTNSSEGKASNTCKTIVIPNLNKPLLVAIVSSYKLNSETELCDGKKADVCYFVVQGLATFQFCGYATQGFGTDKKCPKEYILGDAPCPIDDETKQKAGLICGYFVPGSVTEGEILNSVGSPALGDFGTRAIKFIG